VVQTPRPAGFHQTPRLALAWSNAYLLALPYSGAADRELHRRRLPLLPFPYWRTTKWNETVPHVSPGRNGPANHEDIGCFGACAPSYPDLVISAQIFTDEPTRCGNSFIPLGCAQLRNGKQWKTRRMEFSIGGTGIRQREKVSICSREASLWSLNGRAGGRGVWNHALSSDPESKLQQLTLREKKRHLQAFELAHQETAPL